MRLIGCDVFIYWPKPSLPDLPQSSGPLKLEMIANRATKVWPSSAAVLEYMGDEWQARYTADGQRDVQAADVNALVSRLTETGRQWTRVQLLSVMPDGSKGFSQPY